MLYHSPRPAASSVEPDQCAYKYQSSADITSKQRSATYSTSCVVTPRYRPHKLHQQQRSIHDVHSLPAPSSVAATPLSEMVFSKYEFGGSRGAPYVSPIRNSSTAASEVAARTPAQPHYLQLQHNFPLNDPVSAEGSGSTPAHSPVPRTPPRCFKEAAGHADRRYPVMSTETGQSTATATGAAAATTPPTQRLIGRYAPNLPDAARCAPATAAEVVDNVANETYRFSDRSRSAKAPVAAVFNDVNGASPPSAACWLCEGRCLTGPGSTWPNAPRLFFASAPHNLSVCTLTLCATCAAAVCANEHATAREVLQRCQRTPAIRYRTAAYVNAVREYKLLLELMAEKVVRACERMRCIQGVSPSAGSLSKSGAEVRLDSSVEVSEAPLLSFSLSLQRKILKQLLEALEDLLQRDGRATQLAATSLRTTNDRDDTSRLSPGELPFSEIMAPRERHLLLEEMAHVERQLFAVLAAMKAEAQHAATSPARAAPALQERSNAGQSDRTRNAEKPHFDYSGHMVASPRPSHIPNAISTDLKATHSISSGAGAAANALSMLADPRRAQRQYAADDDTNENEANNKYCVHDDRRHQHPHRRPELHQHQLEDASKYTESRSRSPPALTSLQRRSQRSAAAGPAPFPFSPAPHRDHSHSRSAVREEDDYFNCARVEQRYDDNTTGRVPRTLESGKVSSSRTRQHKPTSSAVYSSPGRGTIEAMVSSAMWATYRNGSRSPHNPDGEDTDDECYANKNDRRSSDNDVEVGVESARGTRASHAAVVCKDPENILLNYFAGNTRVVSAFSVSPPAPAQTLSPTQRRSAKRTDALLPVSTGDDDSRMDVGSFNGNGNRHKRPYSRNELATAVASPDWQVYLEKERGRRREAEEALLEAHTRIAALEQTTNYMAEQLLSHRLSVTFRNHLEGMEMLVGRWTLLAQNFCLQKSLLFADEAAALMRVMQRDAYGLTSFTQKKGIANPFVPHNTHHASSGTRSSSAVARSAYSDTKIGNSLLDGEDEVICEEEDELWVSREEQDEQFSSKAAAERTQTRGLSDPAPAPLATSSHTVLPPGNVSATTPYAFPSDLRLKPLALHL